jgi:hypothetical protein
MSPVRVKEGRNIVMMQNQFLCPKIRSFSMNALLYMFWNFGGKIRIVKIDNFFNTHTHTKKKASWHGLAIPFDIQALFWLQGLWTLPLEISAFCICTIADNPILTTILFSKFLSPHFLLTSVSFQYQLCTDFLHVQIFCHLPNSQSMIIFHHFNHFFYILISSWSHEMARYVLSVTFFLSSYNCSTPTKPVFFLLILSCP